MIRNYSLDACALLAYLNNESGADTIEKILFDRNTSITIHIINLLEVYYDVYRVEGKSKAEMVLELVQQFPLHLVNNISEQTFRQAGRLKAKYKISLADAIAIGEAIVCNSTLVTADHHELEVLEKAGEIQILWLR